MLMFTLFGKVFIFLIALFGLIADVVVVAVASAAGSSRSIFTALSL